MARAGSDGGCKRDRPTGWGRWLQGYQVTDEMCGPNKVHISLSHQRARQTQSVTAPSLRNAGFGDVERVVGVMGAVGIA